MQKTMLSSCMRLVIRTKRLLPDEGKFRTKYTQVKVKHACAACWDAGSRVCSALLLNLQSLVEVHKKKFY